MSRVNPMTSVVTSARPALWRVVDTVYNLRERGGDGRREARSPVVACQFLQPLCSCDTSRPVVTSAKVMPAMKMQDIQMQRRPTL